MAHVYFSFLGTNDYVECMYCRENLQSIGPVRFVQEATILFNCRDWGKEDRILIFTTRDAEKKNWFDDGHRSEDGQVLRRKGLERCIRELNLPSPHRNIMIPEGYSEEEIWEIFNRINDNLETGDSVVFDITHAFRSIPLVAASVLHYAKALKQVKLQGIYYGAFEALGPTKQVRDMNVEDRKVRVLDLTALDQLMDWTTATDRFLESGDARMAGALARAGVEPIRKAARHSNSAVKAIESLGEALHRFSDMLSTCRGKEISSVATRLRDQVRQCRDLDLLPPFRPLFDTIDKRLDTFCGDDLQQGLVAVRWCLNHGLIQQGFTFLEEILFSHVILGIGENPLDRTMRDIASQAFTIVNYKWVDTPEEWDNPARERQDITRQMIRFIQEEKALPPEMERVRSERNDLNHAGFTLHARKVKFAHRFENNLRKILAVVEPILWKQSHS